MNLRENLKPIARYLEHGLLFFTLLIGFSLRISGIGWGLPYLLHPDEYQVVNPYLSMLKTHSLNPHFFTYPGLPLYTNGFFYGIYYIVQRVSGHFHSSSDIAFPQILIMGTGIIQDPNIFYLGRFISILFGIGTIYLSYRCAKEISGNASVGLLSAAFTSVSNVNVLESRLILPNIYVAFFSTLAIWFSLKLSKTGKTSHYLLAGLAVGLTASSKYNGAVVGIAVAAAHFLKMGLKGWKDKRIYLAALMSGVGFLVTNFYSVLDYKNFYRQFLLARDAYALGWPGFADIPLVWYSSYLLRVEGIVAIAALFAVSWAFLKRRHDLLIAASFPLVYFITLCFMKYYNEHTLLPMLPAMHILGASGLGLIAGKGLTRLAKTPRFAWAAAAVVCIAALVIPLRQTIITAISAYQADSRTTARVWIAENIPPGAKIALESYSPYVDPQIYEVVPVQGFLPQELSWYQANSIRYLVFSQGLYGRYYANPGQFGAVIDRFEKLFNQLKPVKIFNDGGYEIRIYEIRTP